MFLVDSVAEFGSREINVKAYTRIINGKAVPVKGARRTVLAIRDALNDLRKITRDNNEGAYLMNPRTGKVGQYVQGSRRKVQPFSNVISTPKGDNLTPRVVADRMVLHNHPGRGSLSVSDLFQTTNEDGRKLFKKGNHIFAVNNNGSIFRAKNLTYNHNQPDKILQHAFGIDNILYVMLKKNTQLGIKDDDAVFFVSHTRNLLLQDAGVIKYRAKLTPVDLQFINKANPVIDYVREAYKNRTFHKIDILPKL